MNVQPEYLPLKELAEYGGLSVRTLRDCLHDPVAPLPFYQRPGGKVLVKRCEFDEWMLRYRKAGAPTIDAAVDEILQSVR